MTGIASASEAIQTTAATVVLDCFVCFAPRNDEPNASSWCFPKPGSAAARPRLPRMIAAVARHYRLLTPVAWPMQMPNNRARRGAAARPKAFSSEGLPRTRSGVDTGSREENASNKDFGFVSTKPKAPDA
jgi:hypothetical protein